MTQNEIIKCLNDLISYYGENTTLKDVLENETDIGNAIWYGLGFKKHIWNWFYVTGRPNLCKNNNRC